MARQKIPRRISRTLPDMMNNEKAAVRKERGVLQAAGVLSDL